MVTRVGEEDAVQFKVEGIRRRVKCLLRYYDQLRLFDAFLCDVRVSNVYADRLGGVSRRGGSLQLTQEVSRPKLLRW